MDDLPFNAFNAFDVQTPRFASVDGTPHPNLEEAPNDAFPSAVVAALRKAGYTAEDPEDEDFGWYANVSRDEQALCLCFSPSDEHAWVVTVERDLGFLKSLLGRRDKGLSETQLAGIRDVVVNVARGR